VRLVLDAHENYYALQKRYIPVPFACMIKVLERLLIPHAHLLIGACDATANHYRRRGADKVIVIGNWKNPDAFRFSPEVLAQRRDELGIDDRVVVAYIGALSEDRVLVPLVQAILERPSFFLILGGRGRQEEELQAMCSGAENVYFPGYIDPDEVPLLTAVADAIFYGLDVNDTHARYNAPNKLYEALAAGKAMLATDIGGELSSVIRSTQCGLLIPQADSAGIGAGLDALAVRSNLAQMQERAKQAGVTTYNWTTARERLLSAYTDLLSEV
jgi:glycosyltransferase involved in cell wall biosynthesis